MMMNNTLAQLRDLKLAGMVCAIEEQLSGSASTSLSFEERLALMVDREVHLRGDKRRAALLKKAQLKYPQAAIEDVDGRAGRGLERSTLMSLALGPEGAPAWPLALGRRWFGHSDHRRHGLGQVVAGLCAGPVRVPARAIGAVPAHAPLGRGAAHPARQRRLHALAGGAGWAHALGLDGDHRRSCRHARHDSITSQLPVEHWHAWIGDATIADAILDRLLSRSHRLALKGKSLRPRRAASTDAADQASIESHGANSVAQ